MVSKMQIDFGWIVGIIGGLAALLAFKSKSDTNARIKDQERRIDAINNAQGVRNEVNQSNDDDIRKLASKWVRNKR